MGTTLAFAGLGTLLGALAFACRPIGHLLSPAISLMKSAPVACVVVILLVIFGPRGAIVAIIALVSLPPFYVAAQESLANRPLDAERVLRLSGASRTIVFLALTWPSCCPYFRAAAKTAVALAWRAGVTGELLGIPAHSIGAAIYVSKLTLDTSMLLAWTLVVMVCGLACEKLAVVILNATSKSPRVAVALVRKSRSKCKAGRAQTEDGISESFLAVEKVTKSFDGITVLDDISMRVEPGERICLMAPTGAGKTTLLRILLGLEQPGKGTVEKALRCAPILQQPTLVESLTALENVVLCASPNVSEETMAAALNKLLPPDCEKRKASELSGGTRRLAEIVRAMCAQGDLLIMDEPFSGLDDATHDRACDFIVNSLRGRSLVVATHDAGDVARLGAQAATISSASQKWDML